MPISNDKYIGFLENLKIPVVTNAVDSSGIRGLSVVLCFLNSIIPVKKKDTAKHKKKKEI